MALVEKVGNLTNWSEIASHLSDRSGKQCRERWHNHLDTGIKKVRCVSSSSSSSSSSNSVRLTITPDKFINSLNTTQLFLCFMLQLLLESMDARRG